jgi:metal-sulfur cluster biosynthetic enzyme
MEGAREINERIEINKMKKLLIILIISLTSSAIAQLPSYVPTNGLIGWWPFNGNANDESGNGNNGTVNGATLTTDRFGMVDKAYSFDGVNDLIQINAQSTIPQTSDYSVSFWFYSPTSTFNGAFLSFQSWFCKLGHDYPGLFYKDEIGNQSNTWYIQQHFNTEPSINSWHFLVLTKTGNNVSLHLDNQLVGSTITYGFSNFNPNTLIQLGFYCCGMYYNGKLDDFGTWNRALTPTEITNLYNSVNTPAPTVSVSPSSTTICPGTPTTLTASTSGSTACSSSGLPTSLQTGLVGYWPFCGNANDASGNGNNGTVNGATLTTDRFGNSGSAYSFDGVNDFIQTNFNGISGNASRSFSLWYYTNNFGPSQTLLSYGLDDIASNYINFWTSSTCTGIGLDISYSFKDYSNSISLGQWNHYVVVIDDQTGTTLGNVKIYHNGFLLTTLCSNYGLNTPLNTLLQYSMTFGKYHAQSIDYLNGKLDDIAIWNRALTAAEIQQLYTTSNATYSWSPGGATTPSITVSPTTTTTYTVTATANGQSSTSTAIVTVTTPPTITASSSTICAGQSSTLTATAAGSSTTSPCAGLTGSLSSGLVGYWPFCGNANDVSGNGNNGTVNGATLTSDRFGNASNAYSFDGINDFITTNYQGIQGIQNRTIAFYSQLTSIPLSNDYAAISYGGNTTSCSQAGQDVELNFFNYNGLLTRFDGTCTAQYTNNSIDLNWHHVTFVINSLNGNTFSTIQIYIDGVLQSTSAYNGATQINSGNFANLVFGKSNKASRFFHGKLDDIGIWNRALTTAEIQQLYTQGQTTYSWSPGGATTPSITVSPTSTTTYTCTVTANGTACSSSQTITVNPLPVASISPAGPVNLCQGQSVTLCAPNTTGLTYLWCNASTTSCITTNFAGNYCLVVTDANGCTSNSVSTIVNVAPLPTANAGLDFTKTCVTNPSGTLVGMTPVAGNTYAWTPATGLSSAGSANPTANPAATITYTLTATNTASGCTATDQVLVTVNTALPTVNAGLDFTKTCVTNPSGTLVGMTSVAGNTYSWTPATGLSSASSANPTANPSSTTTYTLTATNTASGCTATDQVLVTVNTALPTANAGADFTKTCVTNPSGTLVGMTSVAGNTYSWTPATGLSSASSANPTANPSSTTTYTLTATNTASGCTATDQVLVTVNTTLPTANAGADFTKTCVTNPSGTLVGMTSVAGNTYAWTPVTGLSSAGSANPTANPAATTTYTLTATNTASGCTATDQVLVSVNTALPTVNAGLDQTICQGVSTVLNASSNGTSLSWNNGVQNNIGFVPSTVGTTTYTATATGSNGCTANDNVVVTVNPLPSAAVTTNGTSSFCPGSSVQLCAPIGTGYSYLWSGNLGTTQCVTISSSATTSVTVTNAFNCSATSAPQQVTVFNNPLASAGLDATITCVQNASGAQIGDVPNPTYTYSWTPATGLNSATIGNPIANPSTTTTYTLTVVNADGCMGSDQVTVTVNNTPPTANAGLDQSICLGASLVLQGSTNGASGTWNNGVTNGIPFTPSQSGTTSYTYSTVGANGCVNNDQVSVTVNALPVANAGQGAVITCVQNVNGVQLGANPISGNTYTWTPTSGLNNSNSANPTATPNASTTYTLLMSDANGCSDTAQVVVTVNNNPPIVSAGNDANVCNGDSLYLFANTTVGSTVVWNGTIQNGSNILPTQSGYQVATATAANGCTADDSLLVTILQPTTSTLNEVACDEFVLNGDVYIQTGTYTQLLTNAAGCDSTITLNLTINLSPATPVVYIQNEVNLSTDVVPGQTYQWIYCSDLIPVPGATNPTFNPAANAIYAVVVTNNCGSDTSSCTTVSTIGLADHQQSEIAIYPNPNNGHFTILLPENNGSAKLEVLDLNGRIIFESILDEQANELHLESLSSGTYWLRINQQVPVPVTKY